MLVDDALNDGEAEPRPAAPPCKERFKNVRQILEAEPRPVVSHRPDHLGLLSDDDRVHGDRDMTSLVGVLNGILNEVLEHLNQSIPLGQDGYRAVAKVGGGRRPRYSRQGCRMPSAPSG